MKKIPVRRCVGCGEGKPKKELVRIVRSKEGEIAFDATGRMNGRGAYICSDAACLAKAKKRKSLERAFSAAIPPEVYERLESEIGDAKPPEGEAEGGAADG